MDYSGEKDLQRNRKYILAAMILIPLILLAASFYFSISSYHQLPAKIPTHFGPSGLPDAWQKKSWATVLLLPLIQTFIAAVLSWAILLIGLARDFVRYVNLPIDKESLSPRQREKIRLAVLYWLGMLNIFIVALLSYINYRSVLTALVKCSGIGTFLLPLMLVTPLVFVIGMILTIGRATRAGK